MINEDSEFLNKLSNDLCCSHSMKEQLGQLIIFARLANIDYKNYINNNYKNNSLPAKNKSKGIEFINNFREYLIENF